MLQQTISHYRILEKLGAGGMGEVYLAEDIQLDRKVAIKFLQRESTKDEHAKKRLVREARAAAKLDHQNICSIYEVAEAEQQKFIVMQYIEGETLASKMQKKPLELRVGKYQEAIDELNKARPISGDWSFITAELGCVYAALGQRAEAQNIIQELSRRTTSEYIEPTLVAYVYVALGDKDQAFAWLEKGYQERAGGILWIKIESSLIPCAGMRGLPTC